ncbi:Ba26 [Baboon cytomegalovirus]|nr:Ba26 [Baboon cytomegalovirus]
MAKRQLHLVTCVLFILYYTQQLSVSYLVTTKPPFCTDCRRCTHVVAHENETVVLNSTLFDPSNASPTWYLGESGICNMRLGARIRNMSTINFDCVNSSLIIKNIQVNMSLEEHHILRNRSQRDYHFNITVVSVRVNISGLNLLDKCANMRCTTQVKYPNDCYRKPNKPADRRTTKKPTTKSHNQKHHSTKSTTLTSPPPNIPGPIDTGGNKTVLGHSISEQFQAEHLVWGGAVLGLFVLTVWALRYWLRKSKKNYKREYF